MCNKASDIIEFSFQRLPPEREQNMHVLIAKKLKGGVKNAAATHFQVAVTSAADPQIIHPMGRDNEKCAQQDSTP